MIWLMHFVEETRGNTKMKAKTEYFNKVYDILVNLGGAGEYNRESFINNHTSSIDLPNDAPCTEWRFMGHLGFGGKYWSERNEVNCYREDETPEREVLIDKINMALGELKGI